MILAQLGKSMILGNADQLKKSKEFPFAPKLVACLEDARNNETVLPQGVINKYYWKLTVFMYLLMFASMGIHIYFAVIMITLLGILGAYHGYMFWRYEKKVLNRFISNANAEGIKGDEPELSEMLEFVRSCGTDSFYPGF